MGFVSKETTKLLLQEAQSGNFLLRFSETIEDGAVTFSYVEHSNRGTESSWDDFDIYALQSLC